MYHSRVASQGFQGAENLMTGNPTQRQRSFIHTMSAVVAVWLCFVSLALGQGPPGTPNGFATVAGQVSDATGLPIPGASVTLRNILTGHPQQQQTDGAGRYSFQALRSGRYSVAASHPGLSDQAGVVEVGEAENQSDTNLRLPVAGISQQVTVVSGSRIEELQQESTVKVEAVTREQIRETGYERVSDVLAEIPGVVVRNNAPGGLAGGQQIQGIDSRQVLVLQDGLPIIGARGVKSGILNLDRRDVGKLERIEVAKGAGSALYGSDAMGGVINMITPEPSLPFDLGVGISGGSMGSVDGRINMGTRWKKLTSYTDLGSHRRDAYSLIPGSRSTVGPNSQRNDVLTKFRYSLDPRASLDFTATAYHNRDTGLSNTASGLVRGTSNDSVQSYALAGEFLLTSSTILQARAYATRYDENSKSNLAEANAPAFGFANLNERYHRLDATLSQQIGSRQFLQGGFEWVQDLYRGANRLIGDNAGQQVTTDDAWLQYRMQPVRNLTLTLGGRYQRHSMYGGHAVPKAALVYRLNDNWILRGSFGKGFRAPDLGQLYYRFANPATFYQVIGNPSLRPETSESLSTGVSYQQSRYRLGLDLYRHNLGNLIASYSVGTPQTPDELAAALTPYGVPLSFNPLLNRLTYVYLNLNRAYTQGFEVHGDVKMTRQLALRGAYTFLQAMDGATSLALPQRHRHQGYVKAEYNNQRLGLVANLRGTFFSKWLLNPAQGTYAYGYRIWDLYASKKLVSGLEMYAAIDNLADSTDRKLRNPTPSFDRPDYGRTFRIGMRYSLARREK